MSEIDSVQQRLQAQSYFSHRSGRNYVRILDTPHVWGMPFGKAIMPQASARQADYERAIVEIIQKSRYRCDLASLNSPDPDWIRPVLGAMDTALTTAVGRSAPTQFRFLFGQTPMYPTGEPPNYTAFKEALARLVRLRSRYWERLPELWMGRFYRLRDGILSALQAKVFGDILSSDDTKMTWNHSKIVVADGTEALVGGHNLNMDLFRSYPPVHDVSVVVHGEAAYGAQLFLSRMWECGTDLLTKEQCDASKATWVNRDRERAMPTDPLRDPRAASYMSECQRRLIQMHDAGVQGRVGAEPPIRDDRDMSQDIRAEDLQTLVDLDQDVFPERVAYSQYDRFQDYKLATGMLAVGKYWTGPKDADYQKASELMKEQLIKGAQRTIRMSQMDLISAWKKNWSDHVVCQWIMDALLKNKNLTVEVVVSPLDAGAGAEGDQYSFGSGATRTFELISYYMTHNAQTDAKLEDRDGARSEALKRLRIAPLYFTDSVPNGQTIEGETYHWPDLAEEGYTATLKQLPLSKKPPRKGIIGSAAWSVINASGYIYPKVPSAPGNHAKIMVIDDEAYIVGSDNLYPGSLSEFNYLVEGTEAVAELLKVYWEPLWRYSGPHAVSSAWGMPPAQSFWVNADIVELTINTGQQLGLIRYGITGGQFGIKWSTMNLGHRAAAFQWLPVDVDGDGRTEIVQLWDNGGRFASIVYVPEDNGVGYAEGYANRNMGHAANHIGRCVPVDVDGDGRTEIVQLWENNGRLAMIVYGLDEKAVDKGGQKLGYVERWSKGNMGHAAVGEFLPVDVDGDGRTEIVQLWNNKGRLAMIVYVWDNARDKDGKQLGYVERWNKGDMGHAWTWMRRPRAMDVDGDGRDEIVQVWDNNGRLGMIVYGPDEKAQDRDGRVVGYAARWSKGDMRHAAVGFFLPVDVDGDGRTEIVQWWANGGRLGMIVYVWDNARDKDGHVVGFTELCYSPNMSPDTESVDWLVVKNAGPDNTSAIVQLLPKQHARTNVAAMNVFVYSTRLRGYSMAGRITIPDLGQRAESIAFFTAAVEDRCGVPG